MTLEEAQDLVEKYAPNCYYADHYRLHESDYLPALCEIVSGLSVGRVLDVGPGWGAMMVWLGANGWQVVIGEHVAMGTHLTQELLTVAGAEWKSLDICEKPLFGQRFDLITMTQVFPHLKWNPLAAVRHCKEMLAEGGVYIASVLEAKHYAHIEPPYGTDWRAVPSYGKGVESPDSVVVMYTERTFRELLSAVFDEVKVWQPKGSTVMFGECS